MAIPVAAVVLAAYLSLIVELTALRVTSVASSLNIWVATPALVASYSPRYRKYFALSKPVKLLLFVVPLLVVYAVYVYPLAVIALGPDLLDDYVFAPTHVTDSAAVVLILVGRVIAVATVLAIRRDDRRSPEPFPLQTSGVFGWSRNPGLVGMYLFVAGLWLTTPSATMMLGIGLYVAHMDVKVRMEEDFLKHTFGRRYIDYTFKTGRYFR
jgi:protein-S-isoprenylcysteine O-methyltransferase Ste14